VTKGQDQIAVETKDKGKPSIGMKNQGSEISNERSILFVQWQYPQEIGILKAMDVRHKIELKIDEALKSRNLGEWIAGDMGPGGANMEYGIKGSQEEAMKTILNIIKIEQLENKTVIATDLTYVTGKWTYKILYPKNYTGELNPL
jgi:hypothetical protein